MQIQPMITVEDVRKSADWYERVLGLYSAHGGDVYEQLCFDGKLLLQLHDKNPDMNHEALLLQGEQGGRGVLLWFQTEDFDGLLARLEAANVQMEVPPYMNEYAQHMEVWFRDLDNYLVVVAGPSPYNKAVQKQGDSR